MATWTKLSAVLALALAGCSGSDGNGDVNPGVSPTCTEGKTEACACPGTATPGAQVCSSSGVWGMCDCGGGTGSTGTTGVAGATGSANSSSGGTGSAGNTVGGSSSGGNVGGDAGSVQPSGASCSWGHGMGCEVSGSAGTKWLYDCHAAATATISVPDECVVIADTTTCSRTTTIDPVNFLLGCDAQKPDGFSF